MDLEQQIGNEVLALRYDEPAAAEELARWCGAQVSACADHPGQIVLLVPTSVGALPARPGDWIVRQGENDFRPYSPEDFAARFTPAEGAVPL